MGFFSGGSTTSKTDSYSGLRGTGQFGRLASDLGSGFSGALSLAQRRAGVENPLGIGASGLTNAQMSAFNTIGKNLFGDVSSNYASRGLLSPESISGVIGSSLTQAAPALLQAIGQNQALQQSTLSDRFNALNSLLGTGTGLAGQESHTTSVTKGPNLLGQAVSGWANPAQLGSFAQGVSSFGKSMSGGL